MSVCKDEPYPLGDRPTLEEAKGVGFGLLRAVWTGEFRSVQKGEWYLSGAVIAAYRAFADRLTGPYHIARLCRCRTQTVTTIEELL